MEVERGPYKTILQKGPSVGFHVNSEEGTQHNGQRRVEGARGHCFTPLQYKPASEDTASRALKKYETLDSQVLGVLMFRSCVTV